MRTLSTLTLLAAATATLQAAGFTDAHTGASVVSSRTYTQGVSSDGTTSVGYALGGAAYKIVGTTYTALANLSGGSAAFAYAASSNGSVIVGMAYNSSSAEQAVRWVGAGAPTLLDSGGVYAYSGATAISATGSTIVGYLNTGTPNLDDAFYFRTGTITSLNSFFSGQASRAAGVSADGNLIVGTAGDYLPWPSVANGFIFNITTSALTIVDASAHIPAFATAGLTLTQLNAISGNGLVTVGYAYNDTVSSTPSDALAFSRTSTGTYTALGKLGGAFSWSIARAISNDGSVIVGQSLNATNKSEAFVYQTGTMTGLGFLGTGDESDATGVSADGTVIVGYSRLTTGGAVRHAFVYTNVMLDETEWMSSLNGRAASSR